MFQGKKSQNQMTFEQLKEKKNLALERATRLQRWGTLCGCLEDALKDVESTYCHRSILNVDWSFSVGYTINSRNFKAFKEPHNIWSYANRNLGICHTHPSEKNLNDRKKNLFFCATELFSFVVPNFVEKQYNIQFSKMSSSNPNTMVEWHTDDNDISHQYMVNFGSWTGAEIVCYSPDPSSSFQEIFSFSEQRKVLKFDGRLPHEVRLNNFEGDRYSVILYQTWHENKFQPDPIVFCPSIGSI
jgi:hypothetical protein